MQLRRSAAILLLGMTSACATREIPVIVDTSCTAFRPLSFAVPSRTMPETTANQYDTPDTVTEIQAHDARWDALCGPDKRQAAG